MKSRRRRMSTSDASNRTIRRGAGTNEYGINYLFNQLIESSHPSKTVPNNLSIN